MVPLDGEGDDPDDGEALPGPCEGVVFEDASGIVRRLGDPCAGRGACPVGIVQSDARNDVLSCSTLPGSADDRSRPEDCDGVDNDCDGVVDNGLGGGRLIQTCYTGPRATRQVGACLDGERTCVDGSWPQACDGEVLPSPDACNGLDDDCDGVVDVDPADPSMACDNGRLGACFAEGGLHCPEGGGQPVCNAADGSDRQAEELCDALDNDCDGEVDEDVECDDEEVPVGWARVPRTGPGGFQMGSPADDLMRGADETEHRVWITRPFIIQQSEVTQEQWQRVMGRNPSAFGDCGPDCPVDSVSWLDAAEFCNVLSRPEELEPCYVIDRETVRWPEGLDCEGYRLPTEAEWEYAARAGTQTRYHNGDDGEEHLGRAGWYAANSGDTTHPVAEKDPNPWGLHDMHGNVLEYTWDWYAPYDGDASGPVGPDAGEERIMRGGSWSFGARDARSAARASHPPSRGRHEMGLRVVRTVGDSERR